MTKCKITRREGNSIKLRGNPYSRIREYDLNTPSLLGKPLDIDAVEDVGDSGLRGSCCRGRGRAGVERGGRAAIGTDQRGGRWRLVAGYIRAERDKRGNEPNYNHTSPQEVLLCAYTMIRICLGFNPNIQG